MTRRCLAPALALLLLCAAPALGDAVGDAPWGPVDMVEDPAFCTATVAQWEEREPMVLEPSHLGNHYRGCTWEGRALPWPLPRGARLTIPAARCRDSLALPQARDWTADITGRVARSGLVTLTVPGLAPDGAAQVLRFHPCD